MPAAKPKLERICKQCGKPFLVVPSNGRLKFCSHPCYWKHSTTPIEDRFRQHVSPPNERGCMLWTGTMDKKGYGELGLPDHTKIRAHRLSYQMAKGAIPANTCVLHRCDTPSCVNPSHLFLGSLRDNMDDKTAKGRQAKGESNGTAKLTKSIVLKAKQQFAEGATFSQLSRQYRVTRTAIRNAVHGVTWKDACISPSEPE